MPAISYCGRRWHAASDDFVTLPLIFAWVRVVMVIWIGVLFQFPRIIPIWKDAYVATFNTTSVPTSNTISFALHPVGVVETQLTLLGAYTICLLIVDVLGAFSDFFLAWASFQGSILDVSKRATIVPLAISIRAVLLLVDLPCSIVGAVFIYASSVNNPANFGYFFQQQFLPLVQKMKVINAIQFGFAAALLVAFFFYWDPNGKAGTGTLKYGATWKGRCRICFCWVWLRNCLFGPTGGNKKKAKVPDDGEMKEGDGDRFDLAFNTVAELFANMFRHADLTPSDITAGLILLRKKQKHEAKTAALQRQFSSRSMSMRLRDQASSSRSGRLSTQNTMTLKKLSRETGDFAQLADIHYYINFALGAYGWPMMILAHPTSFQCRLLPNCFCSENPVDEMKAKSGHSTCSSKGARYYASYIDDNCCHCNAAAVNYWLGDSGAHASASAYGKELSTDGVVEIIYYNLDNDLFVVPFFLAKDDAKKTVVISIRGTLSLHDAFTDLNALAEEISIGLPSGINCSKKRSEHPTLDELSSDDDNEIDKKPGSATFPTMKGQVHRGMYLSAKWLYDVLMKEGQGQQHQRGKERFFYSCHLPTLLKAPMLEGYNLVITGHSLGAGVAAILGLMLYAQFPLLKVFAFSPPAGLVDEKLAQLCEKFCLSIIIGKDVVGRLSEVAIVKMRDDLVQVLAGTSRSKTVIMGSCCASSNMDFFLNRAKVSSGKEGLKDEAQEMLEKHQRNAAQDQYRHILFPPGKIWHFQKTHTEIVPRAACTACCHCSGHPPKTGLCRMCVRKTEMYYPVVVPRGHFAELLVSPVMIRDHMPYNVKDVIDRTVARAFHGELDAFADTENNDQLLSDCESDGDDQSIILDQTL